MAKEELVVIKESNITNNCPECFNQDLTLTFYQKHTYGSLFHKTTDEVSHKLVCNTCHCHIYPVSWTEDIERLFNYYKKMAIPAPKTSTPTTLFYVLMLLGIALIAGIIYILMSGII